MNDRTDESRAFVSVRIAVLAISDTRSLATDTSGDVLVDRIKTAGHELADRTVVQDDQMMIAEQVRRWLAEKTVDVIITTGTASALPRPFWIIEAMEIPCWPRMPVTLESTPGRSCAMTRR